MTMFLNHLRVFWQLLVRSFVIFKPKLKNKIINCLIWTTITTLVFSWIMPTMGMKGVGTFMLMSGAATWGFFSTIMNIAMVIGDLQGDKTISYDLSLPLPQWMVFAKIAVSNAIISFVISLLVVPIGKIALWNDIDMTFFSPVKFYLIVLLASLFYGFFSLLIASITKDLYKLDNIWLRIIFPMWFLGCYQFSWANLYSLSPKIANINLFNPITYIMEGARAASLDPSLSLPYWNCVGALCLSIVLAAIVGIHKMKKRLDCL
jgi:ABC-type polysaccharide/polyol phosphate export permease